MPKIDKPSLPRESDDGGAHGGNPGGNGHAGNSRLASLVAHLDATPAPAPPARLAWVAGHFDGVKRVGDGLAARCPVHDDNSPSLSLRSGDDGRVLVYCHAGCPTRDVLAVVGLAERDLFPNNPVVVAAYDYRDEGCELLYQVVRMDPKAFRQRRPDGEGGWSWKVGGVRRVPYRLPELLAADPAEPVFICEGEKDCDRLAGVGLVATTNAGGAGKWRDEYAGHLRGRPVVILPDNDDPGRDHAGAVAGSLNGVAASVRVLALPGLPAKGDVSDWLDAGGDRAELVRLADACPPYAPNGTTRQRDDGTGEPLGADPTSTQRDGRTVVSLGVGCVGSPGGGPVARFPTEVLPEPVRRIVESVAAAVGCPADFPGVLALPILGALVGRKRWLRVKPGWDEYPLLWAGVVGLSGDGKSPALRAVTAPLWGIQKELAAEYAREADEYKALPRDEQGAGDRPQLRQVVTTDNTVEGLHRVLGGNPNGVAHVADELVGWVRSLGQYKGGLGSDRQHWLSIWSGEPVVSNRVGRDPLVIPDPFVAVAGGLQPDALGDLIGGSREDGFAARVLVAYPDPGPAKVWSERGWAGTDGYAGLCRGLWRLRPTDRPLTMTPRAKARWVKWYDAHHAESPPDRLRPVWAKADAHCLRMAVVLAAARSVCGEGSGDHVDEASIRGAAELTDYFKSHARRAYAREADRTDDSRVGRALRWVRKHGGTVTARKVRMYGLTDSKEGAERLLDDLAELGYGTVAEEARGSKVFRLTAPGSPTETTGQRDNEKGGVE